MMTMPAELLDRVETFLVNRHYPASRRTNIRFGLWMGTNIADLVGKDLLHKLHVDAVEEILDSDPTDDKRWDDTRTEEPERPRGLTDDERDEMPDPPDYYYAIRCGQISHDELGMLAGGLPIG